MASVCIRMCARGTVIWPALYRPVTQLLCILRPSYGSPSVGNSVAYEEVSSYSERVHQYKNEEKCAPCVRRKKRK